jgi:hypothetical protein
LHRRALHKLQFAAEASSLCLEWTARELTLEVVRKCAADF